MCFTEIDMAVTAFAELQELDPYRLENMDTYSNLLYIKVSACKLNFRNLIWYDLWSKMAVITISRNFKWQKEKNSVEIFLWKLEVKLKTRWVITGSWEPLVKFFSLFYVSFIHLELLCIVKIYYEQLWCYKCYFILLASMLFL